MKQVRLILIAAMSLFLVACGNADDGAIAKLKAQSSNTALATHTTYAPSTALSFGPCKTMQVFNGNNPAYAALYANSQACASTSNLNIVKLKTSAQFPASEEFCLVPLNQTYAYTETCFLTSGQVDLTLNTDQFTAVALVRKSDLSAYKTYLLGSSSTYPAVAFTQLR